MAAQSAAALCLHQNVLVTELKEDHEYDEYIQSRVYNTV